MTCAWFELLSRIPFAGLRQSLCRRHAEHCPHCLQASEACVVPSLLITADHLPSGLDLWPGVKEEISALRRQVASPEVIPLQTRRSRRWAYAAATCALLLLAGFWIILGGKRGSLPPPVPSANRPSPQTRLSSARIADRPARVIQIQSRNPDRTIFWIARDNSRS